MSLVREVASWSAVNGTERDGLGHRETLGMAMAWKLEMRTEVTPGTSDRLEVRAASGQVQALPALPRTDCTASRSREPVRTSIAQNPVTVTGTQPSVTVTLPSWPSSLSPQH